MSEDLTISAVQFPVVEATVGAPTWMVPDRLERFKTLQFEDRTEGQAELPEAMQTSGPPTAADAQPVNFTDEDLNRLVEAKVADLRSELHLQIDAAKAEQTQLSALQTQYSQAIESLAIREADFGNTLEEPLLELSVHIAEAILEEAIAKDPTQHMVLVKRALELLGFNDEMKIHVSEETHAALSQVMSPVQVTHGAQTFPIEVDPAMEGFGVTIDSGRSRVDGRLRDRLASVREALLREYRTEGTDTP